MSLLRKTIILLLLVLIFLIAASSVSGASNTHDVVGGPAPWTIPAGQCPLLPADVSLSGNGEHHTVINTKVNNDGSKVTVINDVVKGSAVDNFGNTYTFIYSNHSVTTESGALGTVEMVDNFVLNGAHHYEVGFNWRWTFTPPGPNWPPQNLQIINSRGTSDPLACDPL